MTSETFSAIRFHSFGLENLKREEVPREAMGPGDVRIKVAAACLNYRDYMMVKGWYNPRLPLPLIPCSDGAGTVIEVGEDVGHVKVGDKVCSTMIPDWESGKPGAHVLKTTLGGPAHGLLATERVLPGKALLKVPDYLSMEEAACLPVAGLTSWSALHSGESPIGPGSSVLLLGTGGVSIMALTIARKMGAEVVITSSSDEKLERARTLGATHTVNYKTYPNWEKQVRTIYPNGVNMVLEVGGDGTFDKSVQSVESGGTIALIGVLASQKKAVNLTNVLMRSVRVQGITVGSLAGFADYIGFVEQHRPEIVIDKVFQGLDAAAKAFAHMAAARHFGKIVISL